MGNAHTRTEPAIDSASTKREPSETDRPALGALLTRLLRHPMTSLVSFVATLVTTTWAGALHNGIDLVREPGRWTAGLPYAFALLLVLGVHEMGHYLAARYHRVRVSLPYFVPLPFAIGTLGAFIRMDEAPSDRRKMFDIAVMGPLAGFVAAVAVYALGLWGSSSLLLAGSLGLALTAFNLLPVGHLDGGHMARALFGDKAAKWMGVATLLALVLFGILFWRPLLLWAAVAFAFGGAHAATTAEGSTELANEQPLNGMRHVLGWAAYALIFVIITPMLLHTGPFMSHCPLG